MARPTWDEYFMEITRVVATRSTCCRRQVGAVIVKGKRVLTTGYNGAPQGLVHCLDAGCLREAQGIPSGQRHELCRGLHAEQNAIIQGALYGVTIEGATLYCTHQPCSACTKMIINAGIKRVVFHYPYPDELAVTLAQEAGLECYCLELPKFTSSDKR
ncbi:deoxycytidylate deaminase [Acetonema longum]|uniref:CMP/dCMP deaminase, zinc-binding protein n=1 Tax=Acetonema longum DSM 6540 TaxID=1009370 RepID=F7NIR9_9FIRM|nr:cytidine/deoxycytidylate deaminase family protein [Acetonema longum]EGO64042.1 CMP/dCMP deaminase, zinc-binding protein [Acetonema longum DSM 6540]